MNTPKRTYDFIGNITTLEPLTVSLKGVSTAKQHKMPRNGQDLPYFPASSFRGALRSATHTMINKLMKDKDDAFSLDQHFMMAQGYFVRQEDSDKVNKMSQSTSTSVDENEDIRASNPYISLFGRWGLSGKFGIGNALAKSEHDVQEFNQGARGIIFERSPELLDDLNEEDVSRYFNIMENESFSAKDVAEIKKEQMDLKKSLKLADGDSKKIIFDKLNELDLQIKERKVSKGEAVESIRRPLSGMEAIVANTQLTHRMSIRGGTMDELGLFIAALASFARNPQLGGNAKHNYGKITCEWDVKTWLNDTDLQKTKIGTISITENGLELLDSTDDKILNTAFQQWVEKRVSSFDFKRYI